MVRGWRRVLPGVAAVALAAGVYDRACRLMWVGRTHLEVVFVVVDDATAEPIAGAEVAVDRAGGWYTDADAKHAAGGFVLRTDAGGEARRVCRDNMVAGETSGLNLTTRRSVYQPHWFFRASASGYHTETGVLPGPRDAVRHVGHRADRLEVRVRLRPRD